VTALTLMDVPASAIRAGIAAVQWPGRLERVSTSPGIILDGAHNPAGARALGDYIREFFPNEPIRIVFGAMRDKAVEEVTNTLFPLAAEIILTAPDQPRALHPQALMEAAGESSGASVCVTQSVREALDMVSELDKQRPMTTFVTGSLFLVGEARAFCANRDGG
jgi:dihydrofolate synthase/folylpolyglutamate synthase